ncbi:NAD(P)H-binding protein [Nocardia iowensis]|uniref:NmrA family NAD(P)-binding protein n=1 Tax=Nocardia iowensis TaxID=204891 RepID=A0ABX8RXQ5_NOCIO|nr:NAD(P)H-binding protein [Nocardia iowensis]QXN94454.1 NmrA family NAD(P)-binding protein [Nocardia iowensis]
MTTLVTGASGFVGSGVLQQLIKAGEPVRASSREPKPGQFPDGVEVVRADLTDPSTLPAALSGVQKIFLYAHPETVTQLTAAAVDAGVEHVTLLSSSTVLAPNAEQNPIAVRHMTVEKALVDSGLPHTFVRPGYFATNSLRWTSIRTDRAFRTSFPDATTSPVHERDIADVAAHSLLREAGTSASHAVLGPGPLTLRDQVAAISDALGEPVRLEEVEVDTYRTELLTQLPAFLVDMFIQFEGNVPNPPTDIATDSVPTLLGRPALSFAEWARDHTADYR